MKYSKKIIAVRLALQQ